MIGTAINYPTTDVDFIYQNEAGLGAWSFMHFTTAYKVRTPKGLLSRGAGDFLINSPEYPQWHCGIDQHFKNDWFHFDGCEVAGLFSDLEIPVDIPFQISNTEEVLSIFYDIQRETFLQDIHFERRIDCLSRLLFIAISRDLHTCSNLFLTEREKELLPVFRKCRVQMHRNPQREWSIEKMARYVSLSQNRFSVLYKKFFGRSPIEDLLEIRLISAKGLLINQSVKLEAIAEACGFNSIHYFCRLFKRRFDQTPSEFRRTHRIS